MGWGVCCLNFFSTLRFHVVFIEILRTNIRCTKNARILLTYRREYIFFYVFRKQREGAGHNGVGLPKKKGGVTTKKKPFVRSICYVSEKKRVFFFLNFYALYRPFANHHAIMPRFWAFFIFFSIMPPSCHGGWWGKAFAIHHLGISPQMA